MIFHSPAVEKILKQAIQFSISNDQRGRSAQVIHCVTITERSQYLGLGYDGNIALKYDGVIKRLFRKPVTAFAKV